MPCLNQRIEQIKQEIACMRENLLKKEEELSHLEKEKNCLDKQQNQISKRDVVRYSRQMIVTQVGTSGQLKLKQLSVLIVGMGGLGCPAAIYLAAAGVGCIGLVDYDTVEENNLHRQILHNEKKLGKTKVESAAAALKNINSLVDVQQYQTQLSSSNALELVRQYNIVVDASDNVPTRYLVSDACVLAQRPLVSGAALQLEGQLTVYGYEGGPCYRCLYPQPPPPDTVTNCSDAGVLGPVPGVIGTLLALEVMKIALGMEYVLSRKLLLFDGENTSFRTIKLRERNKDCPVCGINPTITQLIDYEQFCGAAANDKDKHLSLLGDDERLTPEELQSCLLSEHPCLVVDVRPQVEFQMCSIPGSVNIPLPSLIKQLDHLKLLTDEKARNDIPTLVCTVCRRGNDSQLAVKRLQPLLAEWLQSVSVKDLRGGLHGWAKTVDPQFPIY